MRMQQSAQRIRVFMGESDHLNHKPLHMVILEEARRRGMAGGTVLRGVAGFGAHSLIQTASILRLSENLPMVVELVDVPEKVQDFLKYLDEVVKEGLVTVEPVNVIFYGHRDEE